MYIHFVIVQQHLYQIKLERKPQKIYFQKCFKDYCNVVIFESKRYSKEYKGQDKLSSLSYSISLNYMKIKIHIVSK